MGANVRHSRIENPATFLAAERLAAAARIFLVHLRIIGAAGFIAEFFRLPACNNLPLFNPV